jgi:exosortase/archaeosortase family protein
MKNIFKKVPDISPQILAIGWIIVVALSLLFFGIFTGMSYFKIDAYSIWIFSCLVLFYQSRQKITHLLPSEQKGIILLGFGLVIFSFLNIPLGFGHPPYSIGDFSILLAGIGLIIIGIYNIKSYIVAVGIPAVAVIGFQLYELFLLQEEVLAAPLLPITVFLSNLLIHFLGIPAVFRSNLITFTSVTGEQINLLITPDCTGIWSLGTFTVIVLMVLFTFPEAISRRGALLIAIGYLGTYAGNILRIGAISMSGYLYGPTGAIEKTHLHFGWIFFLLWMSVFWYYFFTRLIINQNLQKIRDSI